MNTQKTDDGTLLKSTELLSSPLTHLVVLHRVLYGTIDPREALSYLHQHLRDDAELADLGRPLRYQYKDNVEPSYALLALLAEIREAVGDPRGRLMQDELVTHVRKIVAAGHEMRRIINIPAASDHTEWATDKEMNEAVKEWEHLLSYNAETRHP